jgi:CheY-like chemotaxis protein
VLVIEADEKLSASLVKVLGERGYHAEAASTARDGYRLACETQPDCILCNVDLPDIDGFYVARRIRTETSSVSTTPFLFLITGDDADARVQGLHVGADTYLTAPFTEAEVVAQIDALIQMAARLRARRDSFLENGPSSHPGVSVAFHGDLAQMSLPTVLTILEMERRSGKLKVVSSDGRSGVLTLTGSGGFGPCSLAGGDARPIEVLREVLQWKKGRFSFKPRAFKDEKASGARFSIGQTLLEALRLDDESEAAAVDVDFSVESKRMIIEARKTKPPPALGLELPPKPPSDASAPAPAPAKPPKPPTPPRPRADAVSSEITEITDLDVMPESTAKPAASPAPAEDTGDVDEKW